MEGTGRLDEVDGVAGVLEEDLDWDRSLGEEDRPPGEHRGAAAAAGSPPRPPIVSSLLVCLWRRLEIKSPDMDHLRKT